MDAPSSQSSIESFSDDDIIIIVENRVILMIHIINSLFENIENNKIF